MAASPIAILGAGNMASALALNLARHQREIRMYCIEPDVEDELNRRGCNTKYLAGHSFPKSVRATPRIDEALEGADVVFVAVPSFAVADVLRKAKPYLRPRAIVASITKGLDPKTLEPLVISQSKLLAPALRKRICTIGGPAVATEMAKGSPTGFHIASKDKTALATLKKLLSTNCVKVATTTDLKGVGLASALKNPYAIALGMCDGLKQPTNAKALMVTIAMQELSLILKKAGAHPSTAVGLAGLGDLIVTGFSPHGRNRTYGERLIGATSKEPKDLELGTVEGIAATKLALQLTKRLNVRAPLLASIGKCLTAKSCFHQPLETFLQTIELS